MANKQRVAHTAASSLNCLSAYKCTSAAAVILIITALSSAQPIGNTSNATGEAPPADNAEAHVTHVNYVEAVGEHFGGVYKQAARIPLPLFAKKKCQVIYMASPDFANYHVHASLQPPAGGSVTCLPKYYSFIDGKRHAPKELSLYTALLSPAVPWTVSMLMPWLPIDWAVALGAIPRSTAEDPGTQQQEQQQATQQRRRLQQDQSQQPAAEASPPPAARTKTNATHMDGYRVTLEGIQQDTASLRDAMGNVNIYLPGPGSVLRERLLLATNYETLFHGYKFRMPTFLPPVLDEVVASGQPPLDSKLYDYVYAYPDQNRLYWAPEDDCFAAKKAVDQGTMKAGTSTIIVAGQEPAFPPVSWQSCYVSQAVIYIHWDCPDYDPYAAYDSSEAGQSPAVNSSEPAANTSYSSSKNGSSSTASLHAARNELLQLLDQALDQAGQKLGFREEEGFLEVAVYYSPYMECTEGTAVQLNNAAYMIKNGASIVVGGILLILLIPTIFRCLISYPVRFAVKGSRNAAANRHGIKPKPLAPQSCYDYRVWPDRRLDKWLWLFKPLLWARKQVLYAITSVHYAEGQLRWLQVCVIVNVGVAVSMTVYSPKVYPITGQLMPPLAMQAARTPGVSVFYFLSVMGFSAFLGAVGYLATIANFAHPDNKYYYLQMVISVLFMLLLDLILLLQLSSILVLWTSLVTPYPFLVLLISQLTAIAGSNFLLLWLIVKRFRRGRTPLLSATGSTRFVRDPTIVRRYAPHPSADKAAPGSFSSKYPVPSQSTVPGSTAHLLRSEGTMPRSAQPNGNGAHGPSPLGGKPKDDAVAPVHQPATPGNGEEKLHDSASPGTTPKAPATLASTPSTQPLASKRFGTSTSKAGDENGHAVVGEAEAKDKTVDAGDGSDSGSGGIEEEPAEPFAVKAKKWLHEMWGETPAFKYPAHLLAAIIVAGILLLYHYGRVLQWSDNIADCLEDPTECLSRSMTKYVKFASSILSRTKMREVADALGRMVASKPVVQEYIDNATRNQGQMSELQLYIQQHYGNDTQLMDMAALINESINLTTSSLANIANATAEAFYTATEVTAKWVNKAAVGIDSDGEFVFVSWRTGLRRRLSGCSAVGFTLGLLLGLSSLLKTLAAFKRAMVRYKETLALQKLGLGARAQDGGDMQQQVLVLRARSTTITLSVFFFGVLLSTAVIQLYLVGVVLSVGFGIITHPWTYTWFLPRFYFIFVCIILVIVINKLILCTWVGGWYISDGNHVHRAAGWLAFFCVMSIANMIVGLLLAALRIILLLATTIFALGHLESSIFTYFAFLDTPHQSFLSMLHVHHATTGFHDPIYLPGPRGRAHRRWRKLSNLVCHAMSAEEFRKAATEDDDVPEGNDKPVERIEEEQGGSSSRSGSGSGAAAKAIMQQADGPISGEDVVVDIPDGHDKTAIASEPALPMSHEAEAQSSRPSAEVRHGTQKQDLLV